MEYWKNGKILNGELEEWQDGIMGFQQRSYFKRSAHSQNSDFFLHGIPIFQYSNIPLFLLVPYMEVQR